MAEYLVQGESITAVADAIREKGGTTAPLSFPAGMAEAVRGIPSGECGIDVVITSSVTNAIDFGNILASASGSNQFVFAVKSYKGTGPVENQIIAGALKSTIGAGIRYRNNQYATMYLWTEQYDAGVTIGDVYTVWKYGAETNAESVTE